MSVSSLPSEEEEREVLTIWALRFAGEQFELTASRLAEAMRQAVESLTFPTEALERLALFYHLQRALEKWGSECLPTFTLQWRAYRTLFLLTCHLPLEERWRAVERYRRWEEFAAGEAASNQIAIVARAHAATSYGGMVLHATERAVPDPLRYYGLEWYLFGEVNWAFHARGYLDAFEFFSIVIWKANRAKSLIAAKLLRLDPQRRHDLDAVIRSLTARIKGCDEHRERLAMLMSDWRFALPMASAILTVLYPRDFSVYDVRACDQLGYDVFSELGNRQWSVKTWDTYLAFCQAVQARHPTLSLRDADRAIWARSAMEQLQRDVKSCFGRFK